MNNLLELGYISGLFGVKGWVKIYSHTRPRIGISQYSQFYAKDSAADDSATNNSATDSGIDSGFDNDVGAGSAYQAITFTTIKTSGKNIIGHIAGVNSRESASAYVGKILLIKNSDLPKLENEYYWHELIGLQVINQQGQALGKIVEMMETGANDVMVINSDNGEEILIPYSLSHFVRCVDIKKGIMQVDWELDDNEL
ncbi:MAG: 16S rRNA processing protein RimM [Gammaproteobacteria bacterium]|nr:MAG: 16S rRNA processing protein RimM [Gammaproteobacteria bacterium]